MKSNVISIDELVPDDMNANRGTEYGQHLIESSLQKFGAGRSILIDKNNRIIAGNKTVENAAAIGLSKVLVVEADGSTIVAVKRKDIDLNSAAGREMALADNATAKANIDWDEDNIRAIAQQWDVEPDGWGVKVEEELSNDQKFGEKEIDQPLSTEHQCPQCGFSW